MLAEISPQVELVQVILYLADRQDKTCQYLNNRIYVDSIEKWFGRFKNHKAVLLTQQLITKQSFFHIKPLRAIFRLETILSDAQNEYYEWGTTVKSFADETGFDAFFKSHRSFYEEILNYVNN